MKHGRKFTKKINEPDEYSKEYKELHKAINNLYGEQGFLRIPSINVFANVEGAVKVDFYDSAEETPLPDFVKMHADEIMNAHKTSSSKNKDTIRLNDLDYDDEKHTLKMTTGRTCYNYMLLTNRCMDYEFHPGMTLRNMLEYRDKVLPLKETSLGNQIGVEGLVLTTDGYTLIEKRLNNQRTTWRDKFSQPISLSLSKADMLMKGENVMLTTEEQVAEWKQEFDSKADSKTNQKTDQKAVSDSVACGKSKIFDSKMSGNKRLERMIEKHLRESYGLYMKGYEKNIPKNSDGNPKYEADYSFNTSTNLMGLARDLLEGGKPNLYFYVKLDYDSGELKKRMEERAADPAVGISPENIRRIYFLYPIDSIAVDFNYRMTLDATKDKCIRIYRFREYQKVKNKDELNRQNEILKEAAKRKFFTMRKNNKRHPYFKECGEAFLGCMAYYEMCKERING